MILTKSDYMLFRECAKNAWMKIHKPDIYSELNKPSVFDQLLMQGGLQVDLLAKDLFPTGVFISGRGAHAQEITKKLIKDKTPVLFQPEFLFDGFSAALDILVYDPKTDSYSIYEVKASNQVKPEYLEDLTFQVNLLRMSGLKVSKAFIVHLNKEYIRNGSLDKQSLFHKEDVTEIVEEMCNEIKEDMYFAKNYLSQESLPHGFCSCVYKGRSNHCVTFSVHNSLIPEYSVHDISRISAKRLIEFIDGGVYSIDEIPVGLNLTPNQQNQIDTHNSDIIISDRDAIAAELDKLEFPLYFLDYETLNPAIPRFSGFSPYKHIPFQYALYVLDSPTAEPRLYEFLHTENTDPSRSFAESLQKHIGGKGSVIVWHDPFEMGRNDEIAKHVPDVYDFIINLNKRIYDLRDIFSKQLYVHKDFKGSSSIKKVLPAICPSLSYKELGIQDGGMASQAWNELVTGNLPEQKRQEIIKNLKKYCGLDAYAMYAIWKELNKIVITPYQNIIDRENSTESLAN